MAQDQAILQLPGNASSKLGQRLDKPVMRNMALAGLLLACWCLSGISLVPLNARDVYERLGAPAGILGPGLHVHLPWPFGRVRQVEFGAVHRVELASLPGVSVLYRVGLTDAQALDATYASADPDRLVQALGSQAAMEGAGALAPSIQAALDREGSGLEILGLVSGPHARDAADALQAADISARAILAEVRGRAAADLAQSRQLAADQVAGARAKAAETVASARSLLVAFSADRIADKANSKAFLLERYFANLTRAIGKLPKTIIDHRLNWPAAPELDLRPPPGVAPGVGKGN